jgi:hypothetical protein
MGMKPGATLAPFTASPSPTAAVPSFGARWQAALAQHAVLAQQVVLAQHSVLAQQAAQLTPDSAGAAQAAAPMNLHPPIPQNGGQAEDKTLGASTGGARTTTPEGAQPGQPGRVAGSDPVAGQQLQVARSVTTAAVESNSQRAEVQGSNEGLKGTPRTRSTHPKKASPASATVVTVAAQAMATAAAVQTAPAPMPLPNIAPVAKASMQAGSVTAGRELAKQRTQGQLQAVIAPVAHGMAGSVAADGAAHSMAAEQPQASPSAAGAHSQWENAEGIGAHKAEVAVATGTPGTGTPGDLSATPQVPVIGGERVDTNSGEAPASISAPQGAVRDEAAPTSTERGAGKTTDRRSAEVRAVTATEQPVASHAPIAAAGTPTFHAADMRAANATAGSHDAVGGGLRGMDAAGRSATGSDPFAALDGDGTAPPTTWIHAGAHRAEAGYLDPALGWVSVRADAAGSTTHASIVPATAEAAQVLGAHVSGLSAYMAEHHGAATTVHMTTPDGAQLGDGWNQGRGMGQQGGQEPGARQDAEAAAGSGTVQSAVPARAGVSPLAGLEGVSAGIRPGATISLVA